MNHSIEAGCKYFEKLQRCRKKYYIYCMFRYVWNATRRKTLTGLSCITTFSYKLHNIVAVNHCNHKLQNFVIIANCALILRPKNTN